MNPTDTPVMLFAAGLGTRLKPFTLSAPKALFPVNGKPLLQRNLEYLKSYGFINIIINVHHYSDQIVNFLEENHNFGLNITISDESDELLETGGGLLKARQLLGNQPFLVMNSDILTDLNLNHLLAFHTREKPLVTLAVSDRTSTRKLLFDDHMNLVGWKDLRNGEQIIENPNFDKELAFSGIQIIDPQFFNVNSFSGKFSIMKSYLDLMKNYAIKGFDHTGDKFIDVGKPEAVRKAEILFP